MSLMKQAIAASVLALTTAFSAQAEESVPYAVDHACIKEALAQTFEGSLEFMESDDGVAGTRNTNNPDTNVSSAISAMVMTSPSGEIQSLDASVRAETPEESFSSTTKWSFHAGKIEARTLGDNPVTDGITQAIARKLDEHLRDCAHPLYLSSDDTRKQGAPSPKGMG